MGQQRVNHIAPINSESEYANSAVNNDIDRIIDIHIWPSKWERQLFVLTCFMGSYDRFTCTNIFT